MLPHSWVKAFSDISDSVAFDKYCLRVKGASYDISYLIYLKIVLTNVASQLYIGISLRAARVSREDRKRTAISLWS